MSEKINIGDIIVTTIDSKFAGKIIPQGSYFTIREVATGISTKRLLFHVEGDTWIFDDGEVMLAKTFSLGEVIKYCKTNKHTGIVEKENYSVIKVYTNEGRLKYDLSATKGATKIKGIDSTTLMVDNVINNIKSFDNILIVAKGERYREIHTVNKIHNTDGHVFYEVKGGNLFSDKDVRIWETKDEIVKRKFYTLSKMLRENGQKIRMYITGNYIHDFTDHEFTILNTNHTTLKEYFNHFMDERVFSEETISELNIIYKENVEIQKRIKHWKRISDEDVKKVV